MTRKTWTILLLLAACSSDAYREWAADPQPDVGLVQTRTDPPILRLPARGGAEAGSTDPYNQAGCDDGNPCTDDTYEPANGTCVSIPRNCDDGDASTVDTCDPRTGECVHAWAGCDDGNPCTDDTYEPANGTCVSIPRNCDDGDASTVDSCDPRTGECVHA